MTSAPTPFAVGQALGQSPYPLLAVDLDQLAILGANDAAYELLDRAPNSLDGVPVLDLASSVRPPSPAALNLLASGVIEAYRALRDLRRPDGSEFTANICVRVAYDWREQVRSGQHRTRARGESVGSF